MSNAIIMTFCWVLIKQKTNAKKGECYNKSRGINDILLKHFYGIINLKKNNNEKTFKQLNTFFYQRQMNIMTFFDNETNSRLTKIE